MATWEKMPEKKYAMPFMPKNGYVSYQNPPDFTWKSVNDAQCYELQISKTQNFESIAYAAKELEYNFYNFDKTFETGVKYWWRVRYLQNGEASEWSVARRFMIHPSAVEFPVPPIDVLLKNIGKSHPRICVVADKLADFRAKKDRSKVANSIYDSYIERAKALAEFGFIDPEPTFEPNEDWVIHSRLKLELSGKAGAIITKAFTCGFAYLLTGDEKIAEYGIKVLVSIAKWDIYGATSYKNQDQVHRDIAYRCAMAYDWLCDLMSAEEKKIVLDMIRERTKIMEYLLPRLKECPYDSHGWTAFGYIGIISIATYGEIPEAHDWLRQIIPQYTVILPPWSYQDGGWCQGTDYWQYSTTSNKEFIDVLRNAGIIDLYKKSWQHNEYLWSLYAYPYGLTGSFGDDSNRKQSGVLSKNSLYRDAYYSQNPIAKWLAEKHGDVSLEYYNYNISDIEKIEARPPARYQLSHHFRDIGWAVMANDIFTRERISMTFKSSPYGSFNHSHADQNSFIIQAFGENLAIKSGYYDAYHSKHDSGFTRKSHAHNTVTMSKSRGQRDDMLAASGSITSFITQCDFDLVIGDATPAYMGELDKFRRLIIYVRPDVFVVVDDLLANEGKKERFEWWLNAENDIEITNEGRGAKLTEGIAVLDADVIYPEKVSANVINTFSGSDGVEYPAAGAYKKSNVQRRVYFETEELFGTKMIVCMGVRKNNAAKKNIKTQAYEKYCKIIVDGDTVIYVNLGDKSDEVITEDGFVFTGAAAVIGARSAMLADGVALSNNGKEIIFFEKPASAVIGCDELSVFTDEDNKLTVGKGNCFAPEIERITDYDGFEASPAIGVDTLEFKDSSCVLSLLQNEYSFMLNGKLVSAQELDGELELVVDGEKQNITNSGFIARNGKPYFTYNVDIPLANYKAVYISNDASVSEFPDDSINTVTSKITLVTTKTNSRIELKTNNIKITAAHVVKDYDALKETLPVFFEAESFIGKCAGGAHIYSTRSFLSGGAGVTGFNSPTTVLKYEIDIPEAGEYDFAVKYVSWENGGAMRSVYIDGVEYGISLPKTSGWGTTPNEWVAGVAPIAAKLDAGKHNIVVQPRLGLWNIDWFGFIKK